MLLAGGVANVYVCVCVCVLVIHIHISAAAVLRGSVAVLLAGGVVGAGTQFTSFTRLYWYKSTNTD